MIQNIIRFTDQIITDNQQVVAIFRLRSLFEAENLISVARAESFPCVMLLDQVEFGSELSNVLQYLAQEIRAQGAVIGLGIRLHQLDEESLSLLAQCSYVQYDLEGLSREEVYKQTKYLTKAVHAEGGFVETIIGKFHNGTWQSVLADEFQCAEFVMQTHVDSLGFKVSTQVVGDLVVKGKSQVNYDLLSLICEKTEIYSTLHGASLGGISVQRSFRSIKHPYQAITGISEHALTKLSHRGVKYMNLSDDLIYIYDLALRQGLRDEGLVTPHRLRQEYQGLLKKYLNYAYKFFHESYQLS